MYIERIKTSHRVGICFTFMIVLVFLDGCCSNRNLVQFRIADPMIAATDRGVLDPPVISFKKSCGMHDDTAFIAWENPGAPVKNRVDLHTNATYDVTVRFPENYEFRRLQVLQGKSETLYKSIEAADKELRENTEKAAKLLGEQARNKVLADSEETQARIDKHKLEMVSVENEAQRKAHEDAINALVAEIVKKEEMLRVDDVARDALLTPSMVESLVNQIEDWRIELNKIKSRIVALNLMVQNTNDPYPRIVRGSIQVFEKTPFTEVGAIPLEIEDEYLDWIREDKVVTIVSYDPNEKPENKEVAARRSHLPEQWPQNNLMVVEFRDNAKTLARSEHGGTSPATLVNEKYFNCSANTFRAENGYVRTYLHSSNRTRMWVFGPDITSPPNVEVWLQDEKGLPVEKLYPPDGRDRSGDVLIRQIAGVEGGAFDPIAEAKKQGKVIAVTRLGNWRTKGDSTTIQRIHYREVEQARERASR